MKRQRINDNIKKRARGRPKIGVGTLVCLRLRKPDIAALDRWRRSQPDVPKRTEAIRRLVRLALTR